MNYNHFSRKSEPQVLECPNPLTSDHPAVHEDGHHEPKRGQQLRPSHNARNRLRVNRMHHKQNRRQVGLPTELPSTGSHHPIEARQQQPNDGVQPKVGGLHPGCVQPKSLNLLPKAEDRKRSVRFVAGGIGQVGAPKVVPKEVHQRSVLRGDIRVLDDRYRVIEHEGSGQGVPVAAGREQQQQTVL